MSEETLRQRLERLLAGDAAFYEALCEAGLVPRDDDALSTDHLETVRVARTLVHELEVNWAGVEIVLRMRTELVETRRQVLELSSLVRELQALKK